MRFACQSLVIISVLGLLTSTSAKPTNFFRKGHEKRIVPTKSLRQFDPRKAPTRRADPAPYQTRRSFNGLSGADGSYKGDSSGTINEVLGTSGSTPRSEPDVRRFSNTEANIPVARDDILGSGIGFLRPTFGASSVEMLSDSSTIEVGDSDQAGEAAPFLADLAGSSPVADAEFLDALLVIVQNIVSGGTSAENIAAAFSNLFGSSAVDSISSASSLSSTAVQTNPVLVVLEYLAQVDASRGLSVADNNLLDAFLTSLDAFGISTQSTASDLTDSESSALFPVSGIVSFIANVLPTIDAVESANPLTPTAADNNILVAILEVLAQIGASGSLPVDNDLRDSILAYLAASGDSLQDTSAGPNVDATITVTGADSSAVPQGLTSFDTLIADITTLVSGSASLPISRIGAGFLPLTDNTASTVDSVESPNSLSPTAIENLVAISAILEKIDASGGFPIADNNLRDALLNAILGYLAVSETFSPQDTATIDTTTRVTGIDSSAVPQGATGIDSPLRALGFVTDIISPNLSTFGSPVSTTPDPEAINVSTDDARIQEDKTQG